jgi:hypothetical protein
MPRAWWVLSVSFVAVFSAACDGGEPSADPDPSPDASPPDASTAVIADWSCLGAPAPEVAEEIAITGRMFDGAMNPIADTLVELLAVADDSVVASSMTGADGTFHMNVAAAPDVVSAYLRASPADRVPLYNYFDGPLREDAEVPMLSLTPGELAGFYGFALETSLDETKSTVSMVFKDCAEVPVADVEISLDPDAERIAYYNNAKKNVDKALTTTDESGFAFGVNAPAGDGGLPITVRGLAGDVELEAALESHPGALVSILVRP